MSASSQCLPFEYHRFETGIAEQVRARAERIRTLNENTLAGVIETGQELIAAKASLPHGKFTGWLGKEFNWSGKKSRRFMGVARWLGSKTDINVRFANMDVTAVYLLTASSVPAVARQVALERAAAGRITTPIAREIIAAVRKKLGIQPQPPSAAQLRGQVAKTVARWRQHWPTRDFDERAEKFLTYVHCTPVTPPAVATCDPVSGEREPIVIRKPTSSDEVYFFSNTPPHGNLNGDADCGFRCSGGGYLLPKIKKEKRQTEERESAVLRF